jgi:hypothetical protein
MPRRCTICHHPERHEIDRALAAGAVQRRVAAEYGVSVDIVKRHNAAHVPAKLVRMHQAGEVRVALDTLGQLQQINQASMQILAEARAAGDGALALKAIDRILRQIELQARLAGELDSRSESAGSTDWQPAMAALLVALQPYPAAREAAAGAVALLGDGRA